MKELIKGVLIAATVFLGLPFVGGLYYLLCQRHYWEQIYLDRCIAYLRNLQPDDPELQSILDYTIRRYNKIGPWTVMIAPLINAVGMNCPWCPGITLAPEVLSYEPRDGALLLVHEALHDYFPWFGHSHIDPVMRRLEAI